MSDHRGVLDVLPTLAEVVGATPPTDVDGISFLPTLTVAGEQEAARIPVVGVHGYGGQQAVRMGRWKGIRLNCYKDPDGPTKLTTSRTTRRKNRTWPSSIRRFF